MKRIKIIALALCCALVLGLAGCASETPATVLTVNGEAIPAGLYLAYQLQAYNTVEAKITDDTALLKATIDGESATDLVHAATLDSCRRYVWINQEFDAQGLSFTEEELASLNTQIANAYAESEALLSANGIGEASYRLFYMAEAKYEKLGQAYMDANSVSEKDAMAYMNETYVRARLLTLPTTDPSYASVDEEALAKINAIATQVSKDAQNGEDFSELAKDALEEVMELCGREFTDSTLSTYNTTNFFRMDSTSYYPEELLLLLFAARTGSAGVYDYYGTPMVYQVIENYEDDDDFKNYHDSISDEINAKAFDENVLAKAAELSVEEDATAVKAYPLRKVVTKV